MFASGHQSAATLGRLAFRLTILLMLSVLWSGDSPAQAAGVLSLLFAAAVLGTAYTRRERPAGPGLNRWHEGVFLAVLGMVLFFWFGRELASDRRLSAGQFEVSDLAEAVMRDMPLSGMSNGSTAVPAYVSDVQRSAIRCD
jgi:hypothetical protein